MRVLFINPSLRPGSPSRFLPVGLGYVVTVVKAAGYGFDVLDIDIHNHDNAYVEDFLKRTSYDVVLMGSIVTHYKWMKWCTHMIRRHQPHARIVVGNSVAGSIPELFLTRTPADVVVMGEGEFTTVEVLNAFRDGRDLKEILGIAYRNDSGEVVVNQSRPACDINNLPMIDWELFDAQKYFEISDAGSAFGVELPPGKKWRTMPVSTARGCIAKCTFCHYVFWDDPYRHRTPASIVAECARNIEIYGANYINFWDDLSFSSVSSAEKVVDAILASGLKFYWSAAIRTDLFGNPRVPYEKRVRIAEKFRESGCVAVGFSLESGDEAILEMMNKKVKVEYFAEQVKILTKVGIRPDTSVVIGYPIETKETIRKTFEMCLKCSIYPSIGFLLPLPSTGMYEYARDHGFIPDEDAFLESITERQDICLNMTGMSDEEILGEIRAWGKRLNDMLDLGLADESLIKTGGYRKHTKLAKVEDSKPLDPAHLKRNENDFSLNYSTAVFDLNPRDGKD